MKTIHELELHEEILIETKNNMKDSKGGDYLTSKIWVLRVPGGWLYNVYADEGQGMTFVPYSDDMREYPKNDNF